MPEELATAKINSLNPNEASQILVQGVSFEFWENPAPDWGGLDRSHLTNLVGTIGTMIGITPKQAEKIKIFFGDHIHIAIRGNSDKTIQSGACVVDFDDDLTVIGCRIVLNRSREVAKYTTKGPEPAGESNNDGVSLYLESPEELIAFIVAEELKHAQIWLKAGIKEAQENRDSKYLAIAKSHNHSVIKGLNNLGEIAASRTALSVLKKLVPAWAEYFESVRKQSLGKMARVTPDVTNIVNSAFIETGFDPGEELNK